MLRFALLFISLFCVRAFASAPVALVYNGVGACEEECVSAAANVASLAGFSVRFVNVNEWTEADFADASVYIQPGGHSGDVAALLSSDQKELLRSFVRSGGAYVGFCAGAFLASARIHEPDGTYLAQETLGLIPMVAQVLEVDSDNGVILPVTWHGQPRSVYWEGGPFFEAPAAPGVEVMATYANGSIASVRNYYGRGRVYVTGFHPEAPQSWRDDFKLNDADGLDIGEAAGMVHWATGL